MEKFGKKNPPHGRFLGRVFFKFRAQKKECVRKKKNPPEIRNPRGKPPRLPLFFFFWEGKGTKISILFPQNCNEMLYEGSPPLFLRFLKQGRNKFWPPQGGRQPGLKWKKERNILQTLPAPLPFSGENNTKELFSPLFHSKQKKNPHPQAQRKTKKKRVAFFLVSLWPKGFIPEKSRSPFLDPEWPKKSSYKISNVEEKGGETPPGGGGKNPPKKKNKPFRFLWGECPTSPIPPRKKTD